MIWDPEATFVVDPAALYHRHPITPYAGRTLRGVVRTTMLRGTVIYDDGQFTSDLMAAGIAAERLTLRIWIACRVRQESS